MREETSRVAILHVHACIHHHGQENVRNGLRGRQVDQHKQKINMITWLALKCRAESPIPEVASAILNYVH